MPQRIEDLLPDGNWVKDTDREYMLLEERIAMMRSNAKETGQIPPINMGYSKGMVARLGEKMKELAPQMDQFCLTIEEVLKDDKDPFLFFAVYRKRLLLIRRSKEGMLDIGFIEDMKSIFLEETLNVAVEEAKKHVSKRMVNASENGRVIPIEFCCKIVQEEEVSTTNSETE